MNYGCLTQSPFQCDSGINNLKQKMRMADRLRKTSLATSHSTYRKRNQSPELSTFSRKNSIRLSTSKQPWRANSRQILNYQGQLESNRSSHIYRVSSRNFKEILRTRMSKNTSIGDKRKQLIFTAKEKEQQVCFDSLCKLLGIVNAKSRA